MTNGELKAGEEVAPKPVEPNGLEANRLELVAPEKGFPAVCPNVLDVANGLDCDAAPKATPVAVGFGPPDNRQMTMLHKTYYA